MKFSLVTHRGIDIQLGESPQGSPLESTKQAFESQIMKGFGLEFDLQLMSDQKFLITHDRNLNRFSNGQIQSPVKDLSSSDIQNISSNGRSLMDLESILDLIADRGKSFSTLHLKSHVQNPKELGLILPLLKSRQDQLKDRLILFDIKPDVALFLKKELPHIARAASVVHPHDKARFNAVTGQTLITIEELYDFADRYDWAWMDEWDLKDQDGKSKSLINTENITRLKSSGFGVAVVSPELHATSPGLLGGEAHEIGAQPDLLVHWWKTWLNQGIDLLCSDHCTWINDNLKMRKI